MDTCPYCLTPVSADEHRAVCERCGAVHHAECWQENGGCAAKDCAKANDRLEIEIPDADAGRLVLSREAVEAARHRRTPRIHNPCMRCGKELPEGELYCPECTPARPEDEDAKNLLPVMIIIAILAGLVAWAIVGGGCEKKEEAPGPSDPRVIHKLQTSAGGAPTTFTIPRGGR